MFERHLDKEKLADLLSLALKPAQFFQATWHLYLCTSCRELLLREYPQQGRRFFLRLYRRISPMKVEGLEDYPRKLKDLAEVLATLGGGLMAEERNAPKLLQELRQQPQTRRLWMVANGERFQTYGLAQTLLRESRGQWHEDPALALDLAALALRVTETLSADTYSILLLKDLEAEGWAYVGNCRRILSDFRGAEEAFERANHALAAGSQDPLDRALLLDLRSSLLRDQRKLGESLQVLDDALALYAELGDRHARGKALIKKAMVQRELGELPQAILLLRRAIQLIDRVQDPRLHLYIHHNLTICLNDSGRHEEARLMLVLARREAIDFGDRLDLVRLSWLEGLVAREQGASELAEDRLREARDAFAQEGLGMDAALAALDLAVLYLRQRRTREARELAEEMHVIFRARDVHREAEAALLLLKEALEREQASVSLVLQVAAYLGRARRNPDLAFRV
jgi:tetratricopeptide (TPR) repeat protein